jgi:hypothetical protein
MLPFDVFKRQADAIPYQYRHPAFLYALVKWLQPRTVVEVGTHIGMSAVWMARGLQENGAGRLHCIDSFCWSDQPTQEQQWHTNIVACGVQNVVTLIKGRSQEVEWPVPVDMAYIDGNHTYAACSFDLLAAITRGARCVCLNDTVTCMGARLVGDDFRKSHASDWDFLEVNFDAGLLVAVKREPKPSVQQGDYDQWDKQ